MSVANEIVAQYPEGMAFEAKDLEDYVGKLNQPFYGYIHKNYDEDNYWEMQNAFKNYDIGNGKMADISRFYPTIIDDTDSCKSTLKYSSLPQPIPLDDTNKIPVVQKVIQKNYEIVQVDVTEQSLETYKGIPPLKVVMAMSAAWKSGQFDKMAVLDINERKLELPAATQPLIIDPLFCCKKSEFPNRYYLLAGWIKDVSLAELVQDYALQGKTFPQLIQGRIA